MAQSNKLERMEKIILKISGMHCASCAENIENALKKEAGVKSANVNFASKEALIEFKPEIVDITRIKNVIRETGYNILEVKREIAKDPVCGMVVPKETAIKKNIGGRTYYFCSESCLRTFESPEKELKDMKRRVTLAISGVLILAVLRAAFFLGLATGATILTWAPIPQLPWFTWGVWLFIITTPVMIFGGKGFLVGAYNAIKNRTANMDLLIAIGTWTAYLYSVFVIFFPNTLLVKEKDVYFEVAAIIIAFVLFGKYMEEIVKKKSSAAIRKLMDLRPAMAKVLSNGEEIEVPVENVKAGNILIIRPGDKIPVDGIVIDGSSAVDEKMITGESMPVLKGKGDKVIGATINKQGMLKIRATNVGGDSALMQIIKMVEEAQLSTVKIQRLVDKVASYFVPLVLSVAALAFIGWFLLGNFNLALLSFIAVLIIACPCALGLATPAALLGGIGKGAEYGILIRNGDVLERAEKLQTIIFDKTGTLTKGEAVVTDIIGFDKPRTIFQEDSSGKQNTQKMVRGKDKMEILKLAAIVEKGSEHPLGAAIINKAKEEEINIPEAKNYEAFPGLGIKAIYNEKLVSVGNRRFIKEDGINIKNIEEEIQKLEYEGKTTVIVSYDKKLVGIIAVTDILKEFAREAIQELKKMGQEIIMITGDNERTARAIAKKVGIDKIFAQVLPKDKVNEVRKLQAEGKIVAFVGDGINDSPALAQADVGIAIGSGSDIAKETGGIILIRDDLRDVVAGIKLSQATMKKIKQNLFWAFIYNTVGIPIAAFGLLNPIIAAAAMAFSSLSVVLNSVSLKRLNLRKV